MAKIWSCQRGLGSLEACQGGLGRPGHRSCRRTCCGRLSLKLSAKNLDRKCEGIVCKVLLSWTPLPRPSSGPLPSPHLGTVAASSVTREGSKTCLPKPSCHSNNSPIQQCPAGRLELFQILLPFLHKALVQQPPPSKGNLRAIFILETWTDGPANTRGRAPHSNEPR